MTQDEKDRLLDLLDNETKWCQEADARDGQGDPVHYDGETAVAWDIVGGMCRLFGWDRSCELFATVAQHVAGPRPEHPHQDQGMRAMAAVQDFNDDPNTTYESVIAKLRDIPTSQGSPFPAALPPDESATLEEGTST